MNRTLATAALLVSLTTSAVAQVDAPPPEPPPPPEAIMMRPPPACDADEVERARVSINVESDQARRWNLAWGLLYLGFAGLQVGLAQAEFSVSGEFDGAAESSLYIGAGKAMLGAATRVVLPLRIPKVAASGDPCADAKAIERARAIASKKEQRTFWLQLGGGMALHVLGGGYLIVYEDSWSQALTSLGIGIVVSGVTLYTEPKTSWRRGHTRVGVTPIVLRDGAGIGLAGTF